MIVLPNLNDTSSVLVLTIPKVVSHLIAGDLDNGCHVVIALSQKQSVLHLAETVPSYVCRKLVSLRLDPDPKIRKSNAHRIT